MSPHTIGAATLAWRLLVAALVIAARWTLGAFLPRGSAGHRPIRGTRGARAGARGFSDHRTR